MKHYLVPKEEAEKALVSLRSAIDNVMEPKYRAAFMAESRLSDYIGTIRSELLLLHGYLATIEDDANEMQDIAEVADQLGGFV